MGGWVWQKQIIAIILAYLFFIKTKNREGGHLFFLVGYPPKHFVCPELVTIKLIKIIKFNPIYKVSRKFSLLGKKSKLILVFLFEI